MTAPQQFPLVYVGPDAVNPGDLVSAPEAVELMTAPGVVTAQSVQNQLADMQTPASHTAPPNPAPPAGENVYATTAYMQSYLTPTPPQTANQIALTAQQVPNAALGAVQSTALTGQYYGVAQLDNSTPYPLLSPSIFPPGGQGYLMGSWGPTSLQSVTWPQAAPPSAPINIANWAIGPQNITNWMPLVLASVSVSSTMAYPVVYVTISNAPVTTGSPVPAFATGNVVAMGQGRRFFNDSQAVVVWPSNPSSISLFSHTASYSIYASLWVGNLLGSSAGSKITGATVNTAGLYLWQGAS